MHPRRLFQGFSVYTVCMVLGGRSAEQSTVGITRNRGFIERNSILFIWFFMTRGFRGIVPSQTEVPPGCLGFLFQVSPQT